MIAVSQDISRKTVIVVTLEAHAPRVTDNSMSYYPYVVRSLVCTQRVGVIGSNEKSKESIIEPSVFVNVYTIIPHYNKVGEKLTEFIANYDV